MRKYSIAMRLIISALAVLFLAGCAGQHGAQGRPIALDPAKVPNPYDNLVDIEFVKPLVFEAMLSANPPQDFVLIDSRPKQPRYDKAHIPTAVSLPDSQFEKMAADVLPADKSALLVFYCGGFG